MAYTLTYSGGTITVVDGTINTSSTSLSLPGRNYAGYGGPVDQNLVSLLENFASYTTGPATAIRGQFWFDPATAGVMKYNNSTTATPNWVSVATVGGNVGDITAGNVTASGNITANNFIATGNYIHSVESGITATGSAQGDAYSVTKDINVVATTPASTGVRLPATTGGYKFTVINNGGNLLNVYPDAGAAINSGGVNAAYSLSVGGRLDFISVSATQWYTLNSTYA